MKKTYSANCNLGLHFKLMVSRIWVDRCTERDIVLWGDFKLMWFEADVKICTYYPSDANSTTKLVPKDYYQPIQESRSIEYTNERSGPRFKPFTFKFFLLFFFKGDRLADLYLLNCVHLHHPGACAKNYKQCKGSSRKISYLNKIIQAGQRYWTLDIATYNLKFGALNSSKLFLVCTGLWTTLAVKWFISKEHLFILLIFILGYLGHELVAVWHKYCG